MKKLPTNTVIKLEKILIKLIQNMILKLQEQFRY